MQLAALVAFVLVSHGAGEIGRRTVDARRLQHELFGVEVAAVARRFHLSERDLVDVGEVLTHCGDLLTVARIGGELIGVGSRLLEIADRFVVLLLKLRLLRERIAARRRHDREDVVVHRVDVVDERRGAFDDAVLLAVGQVQDSHRQREAGGNEDHQDGEGAPQNAANRGIHRRFRRCDMQNRRLCCWGSQAFK